MEKKSFFEQAEKDCKLLCEWMSANGWDELRLVACISVLAGAWANSEGGSPEEKMVKFIHLMETAQRMGSRIELRAQPEGNPLQ